MNNVNLGLVQSQINTLMYSNFLIFLCIHFIMLCIEGVCTLIQLNK